MLLSVLLHCSLPYLPRLDLLNLLEGHKLQLELVDWDLWAVEALPLPGTSAVAGAGAAGASAPDTKHSSCKVTCETSASGCGGRLDLLRGFHPESRNADGTCASVVDDMP